MSTAIEDFRTVIVTAATPVADRVSPLRTYQGQSYPYVILNEISNEPLTSLAGFTGLDHVKVQVNVWDSTFLGADTAARAVRAALESAGYVCIEKVSDEPDEQVDPNTFRVGFVFDVWQPS